MNHDDLTRLLNGVHEDLSTEAEQRIASLPAFVRPKAQPVVDKLLKALTVHRALLLEMAEKLDRAVTQLDKDTETLCQKNPSAD